MSRRVVVYHSGYGCESGCCGHYVVVEDSDIDEVKDSRFFFDHPYGWGRRQQTIVEFARELVTEAFGEDHVADLDWEGCLIVDD